MEEPNSETSVVVPVVDLMVKTSEDRNSILIEVYEDIKGDKDEEKTNNLVPEKEIVEELKEVDVSKYLSTPKDTRDPSYSNLVLPYRVKCRQRYRRAGAKQRSQFIKEIRIHELLQNKALDGVRIHREFCNAVMNNVESREMITLTEQQKLRIEQILDRSF